MTTIAIQGAEFFAYHGFYPEEQLLGALFVADVEVDFEPQADLAEDELTYTVDYEKIYHIISAQMKQTRKLIEALAQGIADDIREKFPFVTGIKVTIKKKNPPMGGRVEHSAVTIVV